jgi:hypothetical protein
MLFPHPHFLPLYAPKRSASILDLRRRQGINLSALMSS